MAFLKTRDAAEHDRPAETDLDGEIREFVRRDVATSFRRQPESESETVASNINAVLQRATGTSVQEIDKLITELQTLSDRLHSERARVQREVVQYSTLTRAALQSTKIIAESLMQFKKAPDAPALPDLKDQSVAS
jgi:cation transport regulator ChaC